MQNMLTSNLIRRGGGHLVGLHFHHPFDYNGRFACKNFLPRVTKMGSLIDLIKVYNGKGFWEASGTYLSII